VPGVCLVPDPWHGRRPARTRSSCFRKKWRLSSRPRQKTRKLCANTPGIEDTQLSLKGEVKSTKIESCRYGPDGKVQKTPLSAPPEKKEARGLKKRVVEKKTDEMKDYMERVVSLIQRYVPPQPELIKADVAGGNASFSPQAGGMLLQFKNFVKSGDLVSFALDTTAKAIRQLKVDTYLDDADKDKVALTVDFQTLPDGTNYASSKTLDVAAKKIVVAITSKNFQKLAQ